MVAEPEAKPDAMALKGRRYLGPINVRRYGQGADGYQQDHQRADRAWIEYLVGPDEVIRCQRKHHQRHRQQHQAIAQFLLAQLLQHEMVQLSAQCQQQGQYNACCRGEFG